MIVSRRKIILPPLLTIFFLFYILFVFIGTLFSANIQWAFEHRLLYTSFFLIIIFIYNYQKELTRWFPIFLFVASINTILYAVFVRYIAPNKLYFLKAYLPYQFVNPLKDIGHDPMGVFILLPLSFLAAAVFYKPTKIKLVATLILLCGLIISLLRAGYISLLVVLLLFIHHKRSILKRSRIYLGIFLITISLILTTSSARFIPGIASFQDIVFEKLDLTYKKSSLDTRFELLVQAGKSIATHPFTGIGSFSFYYASLQYSKHLSTILGSSHNIFVDVAVENGIPAIIFFVAILLLLLLNSKQILKSGSITQKSILAVFIALFVLFQFSHYHKMYWLLTVFFVTGALVYREKRNVTIQSRWIFIVALAIALANSYIIVAKFTLYRGYADRAVSIYPIFAAGYQHAAGNAYSLHDFNKSSKYLERYAFFYPHNPIALEYIGDMYKYIENDQKALEYYQKALHYSPLDFTYLKNLTEMTEKIKGRAAADEFIQKYLDTNDLIRNNPYNEDTETLLSWCKQYQYSCNDR